jgi:hypothetical protein
VSGTIANCKLQYERRAAMPNPALKRTDTGGEHLLVSRAPRAPAPARSAYALGHASYNASQQPLGR